MSMTDQEVAYRRAQQAWEVDRRILKTALGRQDTELKILRRQASATAVHDLEEIITKIRIATGLHSCEREDLPDRIKAKIEGAAK